MSAMYFKPRRENGRDRAGTPGLRELNGFVFTVDERLLIDRAAAIEKKTRSRYVADVLVAAAKRTIRKAELP